MFEIKPTLPTIITFPMVHNSILNFITYSSEITMYRFSNQNLIWGYIIFGKEDIKLYRWCSFLQTHRVILISSKGIQRWHSPYTTPTNSESKHISFSMKDVLCFNVINDKAIIIKLLLFMYERRNISVWWLSYSCIPTLSSFIHYCHL